MTEVRDRLSEHITAERLKLEAKRSGVNFVVLLIGAGLAFAGAAWIFSNVAPTLVKGSRGVAFEVSSARAVRAGLNEIRIKGIPAGRITGVKLEDGRPVIKAELENEYGPIYRDARAELRPSSALEDQFIDIVDRGTPAAGEAEPNDPLPPSQTEVPVGIDDVLSTFGADTRGRLRVLLSDLGRGLGDRGSQLRQAFIEISPLLKVAGRLSDQLARRKPMTERLVHNTAVLTRTLARRDRELRTLVRSGSETLSTLKAGREDLDATLRALPPVLSAITTSFAATRGVLGDVNTAIQAVDPVAARLDGALEAVRTLSDDAAPAVRALQRPVARLVPFTRTLKPLSADLAITIDRLRPQIDTVDRTTTNLANCEKGVQGFFQWDASMTKFADRRGQAPRGNLAFGAQSSGLASPFEEAYSGCVPGAPIGARPPAPEDGH